MKNAMARMIPESEIEEVKRATDLLALVRSRGIELKPHGYRNWVGLCPFHEDKARPNFIITPAKGLFHCMACGAAGNAIQFIERHDRVSFRHAFELLKHGGAAAYEVHRQLRSRGSIRRLPSPLDEKADDTALLGRVAAYYHQRFKQMPQARAYLDWRGLNHEEAIECFQIGFADRTLGLRLPESNRAEGQLLRRRLTRLGIWRDTAREHFNGCVVVPLRDPAVDGTSEAGKVVSFYGRRCAKTMTGAPKHLYLPGPHRGLFNPGALNSPEIILCEAVFDALTFWAAGFRNVTCLFGTEGFTEELWKLILQKKVKRVRLAYDADEAGNRAAARDAKRLMAHGIEVWRVRFPWGMDANEYARKVTPPDKSLLLLLKSAEWLGHGQGPKSFEFQVAVSSFKLETEVKPAPPVESVALAAESSHTQAPASSSSAALVSSLSEEAVKEKKAEELSVFPERRLERLGEYHFLRLGDPAVSGTSREYRVSGLEKNNSLDVLRVVVRLRHGEDFHSDSIDLAQDVQRRRFIERAAEETRLQTELIKRDLGRLLLLLEQEQENRLRAAVEPSARTESAMSAGERAEALAFLKLPDLIQRIDQTFDACGLVGEKRNRIAAYLACTSRKLERPLAVIIQSTSAAGKSTLMDAVLAMFPEEERIKYSAMTGQSLYYLGETNLKHKILAIVEEEGAEKASYALKLLQSEGELTIASTGKDPQSGKMVTHEYRVKGPVMIFLTTTAVEIDEELQNRCLTLTVDESREQTERIHAMQRQARTLEGLRLRKRREKLLKLMRNVQRLIEPLDVVNPWADRLTFTSERTRTRRDNDKYLSLIESITILCQHQRPVETDAEGGRFIRVTLEDIELANQLAPELLGRSLDEMPPQTRRVYETIKQIVREKCAEKQVEQRFALFSRREVRLRLGWSITQVRAHMERLRELEYVAPRNDRLGETFLYELLMNCREGVRQESIGLLDVKKLRVRYEPVGENGGDVGGCRNETRQVQAVEATQFEGDLSACRACESGTPLVAAL